jgi:exosortase H (IPTLxxWG-CTERM-specific)
VSKAKRRKKKRPEVTTKACPPDAVHAGMFRSERVRFAAAFTMSCVVIYALLQALPDSFLRPVNEHTARMLGLVLNSFGIPALSAHDIVSEGRVVFRIIPECTPIFTMGLFLSFVVIFPATFREKAAGLLAGIPALYLANMVRLAATFVVSRHDRRLFEVTHAYLGQVFTILSVIIVCVAWVRWTEKTWSGHGISMTATGFLVRFGLISGGLFLAWINVHHWYIRLLDWFMLSGFSLFGHYLPLARQTTVYYETFSIVTFASFVLAARSLPRAVRIRGLAAGLGLLFVLHLFHRIDNAMIAYFNFTSALGLDLTLLTIGQYVLPVLLLVGLIHRQKRVCNAH